MSRHTIAAILTVGILGVLLLVGIKRPVPTGNATNESSPPTPEAIDPYDGAEARLRDLLDRAREGDVDAYLDAFAEPLRGRFAREAEEAGRSTFAETLRKASASRKSHALFAPEAEGDHACRIVVESVYPDRNERQTYHLVRESGRWLVAEIETVRSRVPAAKFGAPAGFMAPEGTPVPVPDDPREDVSR